MRRRSLLVGLLAALVAGGLVAGLLAAGQSGGTPASGRATLTIGYLSAAGFPVSYQLTCDPASGTVADPAAVCAEISKHPGMVFSRTGRSHSCPENYVIAVRGSDAGRRVKVAFSPCLGGGEEAGVENAGVARWSQFFPSAMQETAVVIDHAVGLLTLGESSSSVRSLLGGPETSANGLEIYRPWRGITGCGPLGEGGAEEGELTLAVRYNHAGHLVTVMSDSPALRVDGEEAPTLVRSCGESGAPTGPLKHWLYIRCGGTVALADHRPHDDSTIIVASRDYPIVLVTSSPQTACADAARVRREWPVK